MDERRSRLARPLEVDDRLERIPFDFDEQSRIFRGGSALRDDHGHRLADEARLAGGEHRPDDRATRRPAGRGIVIVAERGQERLDVRGGEDGDDVRGAPCRPEIDGTDPGVRIWAAHERHRQHARQPDVVDVTGLAEQHPRVFEPAHSRAEKLRRGAARAHGVPFNAAATASTMLA